MRSPAYRSPTEGHPTARGPKKYRNEQSIAPATVQPPGTKDCSATVLRWGNK